MPYRILQIKAKISIDTAKSFLDDLTSERAQRKHELKQAQALIRTEPHTTDQYRLLQSEKRRLNEMINTYEAQIERFSKLEKEAQKQLGKEEQKPLEKKGQKPQHVSCFIISKGTTEKELEELIQILEKGKKDCPLNSPPHIFMDILLKTAISLKEKELKDGQLPMNVDIPILKDEERLLHKLKITPKESVESYIRQSTKFDAILNNFNKSIRIPKWEKEIIQNLCEDLDKLITDYSKTKDKETFEQRVERRIDNAIIEAERRQMSNSFQSSINSICRYFAIKPIFSTVDSNIRSRFSTVKDELSKIKTEIDGQDPEKDQDDQVNLHLG